MGAGNTEEPVAITGSHQRRGAPLRSVASELNMRTVIAQSVAEPGLLERERVLRALEDALTEAAAGRGRLVLVAGEAGVGKTTVIRTFCDEQAGSVHVFSGACDSLFTPRPLGPLLDVADELRGTLQEAVAREATPHDVVAALVAELRRRGPSILVLEDVHWADEATLDVLRLLARRLEPLPIMVVASLREDELHPRHPLRVMLGEIATSRVVERVRLEPLSAAAVSELARPHGVDADELYRKTGGNPFFVVEVLRAGGQTIPDTLRDAVLARAARLDDPARALLETAATVSPRAEMWLVAELAGPLAENLDECLSSGMLTFDHTAVEFRHELGRLAVYESIPPTRRLELHRRALVALADPPVGLPDAAVLAHHAEAAGDREAVLRFAPDAAARAAALGSHREAVAQYARALRFGAALSDTTRAELLERMAASCYVTDQYDDGIAALEEAVELRRSLGDRLGEGDALRRLSEFLWCPGRTLEADGRAREAVSLLESEPPGRELGLAYANLATLRQSASATSEALDYGGRALRLAERLGDEDIAVYALATIGSCDVASGYLEVSLERARRAGLAGGVARALNLLGAIGVGDHRYREAQSYVDEGLAYCNELGIELHRLYLLAIRARLELDQGRWADAAETAASVMRVPRTSTTPRIHALVVLGLVRARRGDPQVQELLDEAHDLAWPTGELHRIAPVATAMAEAAWLRGAREEIAEAVGPTLALALERDASWAVGALACWWQRAGLEGVKAPGAPEPWSLELAGRPLDAAERWVELGCEYEAGVALAQSDDEEALRRSYDILRQLEASPAAAIVARRLRERGVVGVPRGPRRNTRSNQAQLTTRELEVLRLLGEGLRNAAIAERLFLSPRTVGHHVSAILRKLDAGSRGEAVAAARRLGLLQDR